VPYTISNGVHPSVHRGNSGLQQCRVCCAAAQLPSFRGVASQVGPCQLPQSWFACAHPPCLPACGPLHCCRAFPSGAAVWRQLTSPVRLQEACFSDVVLLYRPAGTAGGGAASTAAAGEGQQAQQAVLSVERSVGGTSEEAS